MYIRMFPITDAGSGEYHWTVINHIQNGRDLMYFLQKRIGFHSYLFVLLLTNQLLSTE
jgi:hypothetical protein